VFAIYPLLNEWGDKNQVYDHSMNISAKLGSNFVVSEKKMKM